jgi:hypothetical protein
MISNNEFAQMKDGVRILNVARGGVIDESALLNALNSNYDGINLNQKRIQNLINAKKHLDYDLIKSQALKFYGLSA